MITQFIFTVVSDMCEVLILELQITLGGNEGVHHCFIVCNEINRLHWELTKHGKKHKSE